MKRNCLGQSIHVRALKCDFMSVLVHARVERGARGRLKTSQCNELAFIILLHGSRTLHCGIGRSGRLAC